MVDWQRDRIASVERGANPTVLLRLPSGFAVMGDTPFLPGYCLLLAAPRVPDLHSLTLPERMAFLRDMSLLGEAVQRVCQPERVNYEIFGNTAPFLHAHVLPRYAWEPAEYLVQPVSHYRASDGLPASTSSLMQRMVGCKSELRRRCGSWWNLSYDDAIQWRCGHAQAKWVREWTAKN